MTKVERLDFDTEEFKPREIPVRIGGRDYLLKEAHAKAGTNYKNAVMNSLELGPSGKVSKLRNMATTEVLLVASCLWDVEKKAYIDVKTIEAEGSPFTSRVIKRLYEQAREISDLREETKEGRLLVEALGKPESPVKIEALREYVETLPDEEYKVLKLFLRPTEDEEAKNEQSGMTAG